MEQDQNLDPMVALNALLSFEPESVDVVALDQESQMRLQISQQIAHKLQQARAKLEQMMAVAKKGAPSPKLLEQIEAMKTWIEKAESTGDTELREYTVLAELSEKIGAMDKGEGSGFNLVSELTSKGLWREATDMEDQFARAAARERRPWPEGYFIFEGRGYMPVNGTSLAAVDLKIKVVTFFKQVEHLRREHGIKGIMEKGSGDLKPLLMTPARPGRYAVYLPSSANHRDGAILLEMKFMSGKAQLYLLGVAGSCAHIQKWIGKFFPLAFLDNSTELPEELQHNEYLRTFVLKVREIFWTAYYAANPSQVPDVSDGDSESVA